MTDNINAEATAWDAKERAGLLATETEESCDQRRIAEDPGTTAAVLADLARHALQNRTTERFAWFNTLKDLRERSAEEPGQWKRAPWRRSELLFQALAANPNTPSPVLAELIGTTPLIPQITRAFFRNPAAPLLLRKAEFLNSLDVFCQLLLLREATAFPFFVEQIASNAVAQERAAQAAARMHIAVAGEVTDAEAGEAELRAFWQGQWAAITPYSRTHAWQTNLLPEKAESPRWTDRLQAVERADATETPLSEDFHDRSGLDLLHHLAHDGNRFVRWKAQTRLSPTVRIDQ